MRMRAFGAIVLTILVLGGLGAIGYEIFQNGYQQGLVENAEVLAPAAGVVYYPGWYGFGFFGLFFKLLFLFLIIGFFSRMFFWRRRWGSHARWAGRDWSGPEHGHESPMGHKFSEWHEHQHSREKRPDTGPDASS